MGFEKEATLYQSEKINRIAKCSLGLVSIGLRNNAPKPIVEARLKFYETRRFLKAFQLPCLYFASSFEVVGVTTKYFAEKSRLELPLSCNEEAQ
jgi:hypothetical protein